MLFSPDYRSMCHHLPTTETALLKKVQMVMTLPSCYKENALISMHFRQQIEPAQVQKKRPDCMATGRFWFFR